MAIYTLFSMSLKLCFNNVPLTWSSAGLLTQCVSTYCSNNQLDELYRSAYRKNHSCETALLEVSNAIPTNMDNQQVTLLTLLDLSAAFDTVPHRGFLERIESNYGITGKALQWFASYFEDRSQTVVVNGARSESKALSTGMPQGSGTGPWGYTKYTGPLGVLIRLMCILFHMFADDTQLHTSINPRSQTSQWNAKDKLEKCVSSIASWMTANRLKLNSEKNGIHYYRKKATTIQNELLLDQYLQRNHRNSQDGAQSWYHIWLWDENERSCRSYHPYLLLQDKGNIFNPQVHYHQSSSNSHSIHGHIAPRLRQ